MPSTPNLERFHPPTFAREIRAFMKKHKMSARQWASLTKCAYTTLRRLESGDADVFVSTVSRCQKFMRNYKPTDA
jgi:hypothetical protein